MAHLYRVPHRVLHLRIRPHGTDLFRLQHAPSRGCLGKRKLHLICTAEQLQPGDSAEDSPQPPEAQRAADVFGQSAASNRDAAVQHTTASAPLTEVQAPSTAAADLGNVPAAAQSVAEPGVAGTQLDPVGGEMIGCGANSRPPSSNCYALQASASPTLQLACMYDCMHCWHSSTAHSCRCCATQHAYLHSWQAAICIKQPWSCKGPDCGTLSAPAGPTAQPVA